MRKIIFLLVCFFLWVSCSPQKGNVEGLPFRITTQDNWGIIGTDGKILIPHTFRQQPSAVVNGMFSVADQQGRQRLYSIASPSSPLTSRTFSRIGYFFEEVTPAQEENGTPLLLIDKQGETVCRLTSWQGQAIIMAHNFRDGRALICTDNHKYGYIDPRGEMAIPPVYDCAYDFSEHLALVGIANTAGQIAYQVIDTEGKTVFPVGLQHCRLNATFSEGLLPYKNLQQNTCGYLNTKGETALYLTDKIQEISGFCQGAAVFLAEQGMGLIDKSGQVLIPAKYEQVSVAGPGRVALKSGNQWTLHNFAGTPLNESSYDRVTGFYTGGYAFACLKNQWFLIDTDGRAVQQETFADVVPDLRAEQQLPQIFTLYPPAKESDEQETDSTETPLSAVSESQSLPANPNPFYTEAQKVLSGELPELDARNRRIILDYMERFRISYTTKDIAFLEQLFSEDALIVVGKVVRKADSERLRYLSDNQVIYNVKSKQEYLSRLKTIFDANREIHVRFSRFHIRKHPTIEGIYGVSVKQNYVSDLYSDEGYLFLLWDFRDIQTPLIHVRTWQPGMLDEHTPLPEQEIFSIRNFNIE